MIKNEREYRVTRAQAQKFEHALAEFANEDHSNKDPRLVKASEDALRSQLADLRDELKQYEELRKGLRRVIRAESLEELPIALIKARVALGLSQRDLAARLGLKEQQIQRYEATNYASASLSRVTEVAAALGVQVKEQVRLPVVGG